MRRLSVIAIIVVALGMASCVKDLEFTGEQSDPLLVVNGIQQVGQPARLIVEKSRFFTSTDNDLRVKDVAVDLYVNGAFKESLQVRDSLVMEINYDWNTDQEVEELAYAFNYCEGQYLLCEGDRLKFEVRSSEFETATAEVTMLEAPNVVSFELVSIDTVNWNLMLALKLEDPVGSDYYNIFPTDGLQSFTSTDPVFADIMNLDADSFLSENTEYYGYGPYNIFSDNYFNGKTYTVSIKASVWGLDEYEPLTLEVSRVDEHLYNYKKTYEAYESSNPGTVIGMFTEPVQVYSNLQNAVGVVCAQSMPVVKSITLTF